MILSKDPEIQKRGLVRIFYNTNPYRPGLQKKISSSLSSSTTTNDNNNDNDSIDGGSGGGGEDDSLLILRMQQYKTSTPIRCASNHTCLYKRMGVAPISFISSSDVARNISHYGKFIIYIKYSVIVLCTVSMYSSSNIVFFISVVGWG